MPGDPIIFLTGLIWLSNSLPSPPGAGFGGREGMMLANRGHGSSPALEMEMSYALGTPVRRIVDARIGSNCRGFGVGAWVARVEP